MAVAEGDAARAEQKESGPDKTKPHNRSFLKSHRAALEPPARELRALAHPRAFRRHEWKRNSNSFSNLLSGVLSAEKDSPFNSHTFMWEIRNLPLEKKLPLKLL